MRSIAIILAVVGGVSIALWLLQAWRTLVFCREQLEETWGQLRAELASRREMVAYLVAAAPAQAASVADVIGNACDLAANVGGVRESSQAETRLAAALSRLAALIDETPGARANANLEQLRQRLDEVNARIDLLRGSHNRQANAFNALLDRGAGRLLASFQILRRAEQF